MLGWILLGLQGVGILFLLWAIRSFGKWAKQMLVMSEQIREFRQMEMEGTCKTARNHTAVFVNLEEPPPEQKAS